MRLPTSLHRKTASGTAPNLLRRTTIRSSPPGLRAFLVCFILILASCTPQAPRSEPAVPLHVRLTWLPGGAQLNLYAALFKGFYLKHGLQVDIEAASHPTDSIKLVQAGKDEIGIAYLPDVILANAKGADLASFFAVLQRSELGLISLKDTGILSPQNLVGKTAGVVGTPIDQAMFRNMLTKANVPLDQVRIVDPGYGGVSQLISGALDAASGLPWYEGAILSLKGKEFNFLRYSDFGAPEFHFYVLVARRDYLRQNQDIIREFVEATLEGTRYAMSNPDACMDLLLDKYPNLDRETELAIWNSMSQLITSPLTIQHGIGYQDPAIWNASHDFLFDQHIIDKRINVEDSYTNDFILSTP